MTANQPSLGDPPSEAPRSTLLRRIGAMIAPIPRDPGALIDDERPLEVARQVCDVLAAPDAMGGLTRAEIQAPVYGSANPGTFDARFNVSSISNCSDPYWTRSTNSDTRSTPPGWLASSSSSASASAGGIDELLTLLDRTKAALAAGPPIPY